MAHRSPIQKKLSLPQLFSWIALLAACGQAAGTRPHEMGAAQHRAAADAEESQAVEHGGEYHPEAQRAQRICDPSLSQPPGYPPSTSGAPAVAYPSSQNSYYGVCWMDTFNPTLDHQQQAQAHRERAARHRQAAATLVAAEERACAGLAEADRDMSPFAHAGDLESAGRLEERIRSDGAPDIVGGVIGARILFRAVPGLTAAWLQRIIDCHLARNAALGHVVASQEMAYCPLTLQGVSARVVEVRAGFAVDLYAEGAGAQAVWERARRLAPAP